jgi:hypothetical protein
VRGLYGNGTNVNKHNAENKGANPRDHSHQRYHFLRHAHRNWRVWVGLILMLAMILVYIFTMDLSWRPGHSSGARMPAANAP